MDGTSMAAPHVCALSALLLSQDPTRTRAGVRNIIASTCEDIDALNPSYANLLGAGRVNAYAALSWGGDDWQRATGGPVTGSPLPVRIGFRKYAVVTSADGCVYVFNSDGDLAAGWPECLPGKLTSPAAGYLDPDVTVDVVAASDSGYVCVWDAGGNPASGWPVKLPAAVVSGPMLSDIDGDGELEIVCGIADGSLRVLERNGSSGLPSVDFGGAPTSEPAFAAMGPDTSRVILMGTSDSKLNAVRANGTPSPGWPVSLDTASFRSPVCADIDGDGRSEVFAGDSDGLVHGLDDLGSPVAGWPRQASAALTRSAALADVDGDSIPDVVAAGADGAVYAWSLGGQVLSGWPVYVPAPISSSPSVVDLDGDGKCEVAVGCDDGNLYVWSSDALPAAGWPRSTGGAVRSSPCLDDFDSDGEFELMVGSDDGKVHFWNLEGSNAPDPIPGWPMYRHDAGRSGNTGLTVEIPAPPAKPRVTVVASPNPFGGASHAVTFNISIAGAGETSADRRGTLLVFDVAGRAVAEIPLSGQGDELTATWDGGNDSSKKLSAGVYPYTLEVDGLKAEGKLVFLKR
jgi:WD40 repeat protein